MFTGRKLALTLAFTVLVALALGAGCRNFFQPNSLVSIAVQPPSPSVLLDTTTTLQAYGTYQDNTRSLLTSGVVWSTSDGTVMPIDPASGVATGQNLGTATITASSQGISGTASATVYINVTMLTVNPNTWQFKASDGGTSPGFFVTANGSTDVTSTATFTPSSSTNSLIDCVDGTTPVVCTAQSGLTAGPYTIVVSYTGTSATATINVTANP